MKFSKFIVLLSAALAVFAAAVSCQKEEASSSVPESAGKVELCITGDFNDFDGLDTKASIENIFRMTWAENDKVYVFGKASGADVFSCLGTLTATPDSETGNRVADLTGTITAPKADTKLTLVYSPELTSAPEVADGRYDDNGSLYGVGSYGGCYWSCTPYPYYTTAYILYVTGDDYYVNPAGDSSRAYGLSVRCLSESN